MWDLIFNFFIFEENNHIMATVKFILRNKNNPTHINVRIKNGRALDLKTPTPFLIDRNDWNTTKGTFKSLNDEVKKQINSKLKEIESNIFNALNDTETIKNLDWLKSIVNPNHKSEISKETTKSPYLLDWINNYMSYKKNDVTLSTVKKYIVFKHLLERFERSRKKQIEIIEINQQFKTELENYCLKNGYANNTIARLFKFIKTICKYAETNGIKTNSQLSNLKGKFEKADNIYLSLEDIEKIKVVNLDERLDNIRDWLLISCYTGQRVSDFLRFTKDMIIEIDNKKYIHFTQTKTNKQITLPLHPVVVEILNKRNGEFPHTLSDQKYNEYIKEVGKLADLTQVVTGSKINTITKRKEQGQFEKWELITSHIGRRSFATNNYGIIPTSLLKSATGHSTEQQFLTYIGKTDEEQAKQLAKYW